MTRLILHAANLDHQLPPGSLAGLELSLKAAINRIEVDAIPMKDGNFALLHDPKLENVSAVSGHVAEQTAAFIQKVKYKDSPHYLGTLSQAVALLQEYPVDGFLQLDLKPYAPLTPESLRNLVNWIKPVQHSVMVSSVADWALRVLHKMAPDLLLGFDPLLYLDLVEEEAREEGIPPFHVGAFGYLDDHPLAVQRWGKLSDYFEARAETLLQQVPAGITWFINAQLLDEAMNAGFNWIEYLQETANTVNAWTLDMDRAELAARMAESGVDYITTNQLPEMAAHLRIQSG
jgi:glycerophosphoryl diester phosphodiesterase